MKFNKNYFIIVIVIFFILISLWYIQKIMKFENNNSYENDYFIETTTEYITETTTEFFEMKVYITGEVINEGVYTVSKGDRICDVVQKAGGFTENADIESINMASYVKDEEHIVIRNIDEHIDKTENSIQNNNDDYKININKATVEELKSLDGIGDSIAKNIIEYRENNGNFKTVEQLKEVSRIGPKLFEKLKNNVTIS